MLTVSAVLPSTASSPRVTVTGTLLAPELPTGIVIVAPLDSVTTRSLPVTAIDLTLAV